MESFAINSSEIHIWLVTPELIQDPELLANYHRLMNREEAEQQQRFRFARHQHQYLVTRALVRTTLSHYVNEVEPQDWQFSQNAYGRPEIIRDRPMLPLRFNLSHTQGLIACGIILEKDLGVDVEYILRERISLEIADRFFSPQEVRDLRALPHYLQKERFFHYWTLKESYIKAKGMGLAIPLDQFSFYLQNGLPTGITFSPELKDDPTLWQFALFEPSPEHKLSVAVCKGRAYNFTIRIFRCVPMLNYHY